MVTSVPRCTAPNAIDFGILRMLRAMKEARALDMSGDGMIDANEFVRLVNLEVRGSHLISEGAKRTGRDDRKDLCASLL